MLHSNVRNLLLASVICIYGIGSVTSRPKTSPGGMWSREGPRKLERFTLDLYRQISEGLSADENMVFSPISIFSALSVLGQGADGGTRGQIKHVLHTPSFYDVQEFLKDTFRKVPHHSLAMAQRIFLDNSTLLKKDFKDFLDETGLHTVKKVDFQSDPEFCRQKINHWVSHNTMDQIEELLDVDQVTALTKLYIVNAIAMEAPWISPFETDRRAEFRMSEDESIDVDMMVAYSTTCMFTNTRRQQTSDKLLTDTTVLFLPFRGETLAYIAVMPNNPGNFSELDSKIGQRRLLYTVNELYDNYDERLGNCQVTMPQYKLDYNYQDLKLHLIDMGVEDVFDAGMADLSKLTREGDELYVSDVAHKATFALDKKGVKATAATAFGISTRMMPPSVTIDKPFLFFVRNMETEALLFMGKVVNPTTS